MPRHYWRVRVTFDVTREDRFAVARHFGDPQALALLRHVRQFLKDEGTGGMGLVAHNYQSEFAVWRAVGCPKTWTAEDRQRAADLIDERH